MKLTLANLSTFIVCVCVYVCTGTGIHATAHVWRSEDGLEEPVFSFYHVDSGDCQAW